MKQRKLYANWLHCVNQSPNLLRLILNIDDILFLVIDNLAKKKIFQTANSDDGAQQILLKLEQSIRETSFYRLNQNSRPNKIQSINYKTFVKVIRIDFGSWALCVSSSDGINAKTLPQYSRPTSRQPHKVRVRATHTYLMALFVCTSTRINDNIAFPTSWSLYTMYAMTQAKFAWASLSPPEKLIFNSVTTWQKYKFA